MQEQQEQQDLKMCIRDRDKPVIFAIGNAPTALIELYDMIEKGIYKQMCIRDSDIVNMGLAHMVDAE